MVPQVEFAQAGATLCAGDLRRYEVYHFSNSPVHCLTLPHFERVPRLPQFDLHFARSHTCPGAVPSMLLKMASREELPTRGSLLAPPIDSLGFDSGVRFLLASTRHFSRVIFVPLFQIRVLDGWTSTSLFLGAAVRR